MENIRGARLRKFKLRKIILGVRMHFRHTTRIRYAIPLHVNARLPTTERLSMARLNPIVIEQRPTCSSTGAVACHVYTTFDSQDLLGLLMSAAISASPDMALPASTPSHASFDLFSATAAHTAKPSSVTSASEASR